MNNLKFRAWHKREKRYLHFTFSDIWPQDKIDGLECVSIGKDPALSICLNLENHGINPELIIEQFTGLLDKQGKEIYEGDIIKYLDQIGEVFYLRPSAGFETTIGQIIGDWLEVIGNIHQDKELLK